jgi:hypothetical protein
MRRQFSCYRIASSSTPKKIMVNIAMIRANQNSRWHDVLRLS